MIEKKYSDIAIIWRLLSQARPYWFHIIGIFLLGLLAVPLCRTAPRQGQYAKTFLAVVVFAAYYNLTVVAKTWMEQGVVGSFPGIWWPHFLLAALLVILLRRPVH